MCCFAVRGVDVQTFSRNMVIDLEISLSRMTENLSYGEVLLFFLLLVVSPQRKSRQDRRLLNFVVYLVVLCVCVCEFMYWCASFCLFDAHSRNDNVII